MPKAEERLAFGTVGKCVKNEGLWEEGDFIFCFLANYIIKFNKNDVIELDWL